MPENGAAAGGAMTADAELKLELKKSAKSALPKEEEAEEAAAGAPHASPLDAAASNAGAAAGAGAGAESNVGAVADPPNASPKKPSPLVWLAAGASQDAAAAGAPHASPLDDVSPHGSEAFVATAAAGAVTASKPVKADDAPNVFAVAGAPHGSAFGEPQDSDAVT